MKTDRELMQQALDALSPWAGEDANHTEQYAAYHALRERLAQPEQKTCLVANEPCKHGSWCSEAYCQEHCKFVEQPAQQQEPEPNRVKFERHWRKTRGDKKANRELPRHPLQPQTYIQDSANRHWVTWQAAVRSVAPPASKPWVGLDDTDLAVCDTDGVLLARYWERVLREKNT